MRKGRPSNSRGLHIAAIDMNLSPISPQTLRRNRDAPLPDFREALSGPSTTTLAAVCLSPHGGAARIGGNRRAAARFRDQGTSEERPVGKECILTCRSRGTPYQQQNKRTQYQ